MLNRVESTAFLRETTVVYTNEYPFTLPMVGIGQLSTLNAGCLSIIFEIKNISVCVNVYFMR